MPNRIKVLLPSVLVVLAAAASSVPAQHPLESLHDRAKKAGGKLIWRYRPNRSVIYPNIEELAKRSSIIVVGRTVSQKPSLTKDGKFITQDFVVRVQEVIKGDVPNGHPLLVSLPGGAYRFDDDTYAYVMPIGYQPPQKGGMYIFFLNAKSKSSAFKGYTLVSGTQGLFALKDRLVEPADLLATDPVVSRYKGMTAEAFLQQIHKAVPRKKK
ncbi:MAG TPA: hypothetical protein VIF64_09575 [Pyrinomonadaceae bacterium]|jgi:hypothetical protein